MTVFKTFLKILNKNKFIVILYTVILLIFSAVNMQTSENNMSFVASKPDVMIGVPVEPAKFRSAMIMVDRHIQAYLVSLTNKLVKESIAEREAGKNTEEELEDAPSEGTVISLEEDGSVEEDGPVEVTAEDEDTF